MILAKTEAGHLALRDRSAGLTPRQRSAFILFDGKRSVSDVVAAGMGITQQDVEQMISRGLLSLPAGDVPTATSAPPADETAAPAVAEPPRSPQQRYQEAYPVATRLTASLGLRGFKLNLQVEGASNYQDLLALAPKIRAVVSPEMGAELDRALGG